MKNINIKRYKIISIILYILIILYKLIIYKLKKIFILYLNLNLKI